MKYLDSWMPARWRPWTQDQALAFSDTIPKNGDGTGISRGMQAIGYRRIGALGQKTRHWHQLVGGLGYEF